MKPLPYSKRHRLSTPRRTSFRHECASWQVTHRPHGSALITAIVFALIVAITLAGIGTLTVSHYTQAHTQSDSAAALDLAEAGVNFELNRLTENAGQADPSGSVFPASQIDGSLSGSFSVACQNTDGTPWTGVSATQKTVVITSSAHVNGTTRAVSINGTTAGTFYTMYAIEYGAFYGKSTVKGIAGTNGQFFIPDPNNKPQISSIVFNGPDSGWDGSKYDNYSTTNNKRPVNYDTVDQVMTKQYKGANYLAVNNDNNMAMVQDDSKSPMKAGAIKSGNLGGTGNQVYTLYGKPGGANYYMTNFALAGNSTIEFDNTNGPINVFYNPSGSAAGVAVRGGSTKISMQQDPTHRVNMYMAGAGGVEVQANPQNPSEAFQAGIYAYNRNAYGNLIGQVIVDDKVNFRGQIISDEVDLQGAASVVGEQGHFDIPQEYFAFSGAWRELNNQGHVGGGNQ